MLIWVQLRVHFGCTQEAAMFLTDIKVQKAKPQDKAYKLKDGDGLFLLVHPNGGKYWRFRYNFAGKEKTLALGT